MLPSSFTYRPAAAAILALFSSLPVLADNDKNAQTEDVEHIEVVGGYTVAEQIDTATGLGLTLLETPQSVSVITAERIQDQALDTVIDVVQNTTGVSFRALDNVRNTLQARGFNIQSYQIDGVPLPWSLAADSGETIADVILYDRVEFVRGSTGLLTGVGDPSGSINLVRKHADSRDFTGNVSIAAGSWNNVEVTTDLSSGLNEDGSVRGRVVAKYEEGDSYLDIFSNESTVLYGVIEGDITDNTLLRAGMSYQNNVPKGNFWGGLTALYSDGSAVDWDISTSTSAAWTRWETENSNFFANIQHTFSNGWELQANYNKLKYKKPDVRLLYVYGALDKDTGSGLIAWPYRSEGESDLDSLDIQLKGDYQLFGNLHEFVVGALYSKQDALVHVYDVVSSDPLPIDNIFTWNNQWSEPTWSDSPTSIGEQLDTEQKGVYAATRLHLSQRLKLITGGRIASWEREGQSYGTPTNFGETGVFIPYAGLLYDVTDQHRIYASYTDIFRPQNAQDRNGDYLDSLEGVTYELGLKSSFLKDRLNTALSVFHIDQDNLAQDDVDDEGNPYFVPGSPATVAQREAQGTESTGFEIELVGQPVDGWNINMGWSQYQAQDADGIDVNPSYPRKQFKMFTSYQVAAVPDLTIGGGVTWMDEVRQSSTMAGVVQDAVTLANVMVRYQITAQLDVQLNVNNLFDEKYYNYISGGGQVQFGQPRFTQIRLSYSL